MNDWDDVVNNLEDEEAIKRKAEEVKVAAEAAKAKEQKEALAKIEELTGVAKKALEEAESLADKFGVSFTVYGPDGGANYYTPKPSGHDEDWEASENEDGYLVGWSNSSSYC